MDDNRDLIEIMKLNVATGAKDAVKPLLDLQANQDYRDFLNGMDDDETDED